MSVFDKYQPIDPTEMNSQNSVFSKYQPVSASENPTVAGAKYSLAGKVLKVLGKYKGEGECVGGVREIADGFSSGLFTFDSKAKLIDKSITEPQPSMVAVMPAGKSGHLGVVLGSDGENVIMYDVNADGHNTKMIRSVPKSSVSGYFNAPNVNREKVSEIQSQIDTTPSKQEENMAQAAQKGVDEFSQGKVDEAVKSEKEDGGFSGALNAAGDKLNDQLNTLGEKGADAVVNWANKPFLNRVYDLASLPVKLGWNVAKFGAKTAVDVGHAVVDTAGAYTDAVKGAGRTTKEAIQNPNPVLSKEFWQTPSEPLPENVSNAADQSKKAVMEASAFLPSVGGQLASGFANEFDKSIKEGLPANQALGRATLQGGEQALATWAMKKLTQKGTAQEQLDDMVKEAKKVGMTERQVGKILKSDLTPEQKLAYLDESIKYAKGASDIRPTDLVGNELKSAQAEIAQRANAYGEQIGKIVDDMKLNKGKIPTGGIMDDAMKALDSMNIKLTKKGNLNANSFKGSDLAGMPDAQKFIIDTWNQIKSGNMDAREAVALARNIGNKQFAGGAGLKGATTFGNTVRKGLRTSVNEYADSTGNAGLKVANEGYHDMLDMGETLSSKITETGVRGGELVRRSVSNAGAVPQETFAGLEALQKKYGMTFGKAIWDKANVAQAAENVAGIKPEQSLEGIMSRQGTNIITNPKTGILNAVGEGFSWLKSKVGLGDKTGAQVFENIVKNPPKDPSLLQSSAIGALASGKGASVPPPPAYQSNPDEWQSSKDSLMSPFIPSAYASPKIPEKPVLANPKPSTPQTPVLIKPEIQSQASTANVTLPAQNMPIQNKSVFETYAPQTAKDVTELLNNIGKISVQKLADNAPKPPAPSGILAQLAENKRIQEEQIAEIEGKKKPAKKFDQKLTLKDVYDQSNLPLFVGAVKKSLGVLSNPKK
jgi:hypothetical protein